MGRKAGGLYINPKRYGSLHKPCMKEMMAFLSCMAVNQASSDACARQKDLLKACLDSQIKIKGFYEEKKDTGSNSKIEGNDRVKRTETPGEVSIINCRGLTGEGSSLVYSNLKQLYGSNSGIAQCSHFGDSLIVKAIRKTCTVSWNIFSADSLMEFV